MISKEGAYMHAEYFKKMYNRIETLEAAQKEIQIIIDEIKAELEDRSQRIY